VTGAATGFIEQYQHRFNCLLQDNRYLPGSGNGGPRLSKLHEALLYPLGNGGKRVRPLLVYAAAEAAGGAPDDAVDRAALAVELVHTYSLVHDDLPAMDDDDLRRGRPSVHRAYDEATAILVGDGLQALAFEVLATAHGLRAEQCAAMIAALASAAGPAGMVGGQYIDIQATATDMDYEALAAMHSLKTGALIQAALVLGGIAAGAARYQLDALEAYGGRIGLAFQVIDDVLDVTGDAATLGKTRGKDGAANKPTYVSVLGLEAARAESVRLLEEALAHLEPLGSAAHRLRDLARYIVERNH